MRNPLLGTSLGTTLQRHAASLPCYYESPTKRSILVESTSAWRAQLKGERDAGFSSILEKVTFPWFKCHICGIGIGPHYEMKHLYLYPVYKQCVNHHGKHKPEYWDYGVLRICADCATDKSRGLPDWLCVVTPYCWLTNALLCEEGEKPTYIDQQSMDSELSIKIRLATAKHVDYCEYYLFLLLLLSCGISIRTFFSQSTKVVPPVENASVVVKAKRTPIFSGWKNDLLATKNPFPLLSMGSDPGLSGLAL